MLGLGGAAFHKSPKVTRSIVPGGGAGPHVAHWIEHVHLLHDGVVDVTTTEEVQFILEIDGSMPGVKTTAL